MKIEFTLDEQTAALVGSLPEPETFLRRFFQDILNDYEGEYQDPVQFALWRHRALLRSETLFQAKVHETKVRLEVIRGLMRVDLRLNKE